MNEFKLDEEFYYNLKLSIRLEEFRITKSTDEHSASKQNLLDEAILSLIYNNIFPNIPTFLNQETLNYYIIIAKEDIYSEDARIDIPAIDMKLYEELISDDDLESKYESMRASIFEDIEKKISSEEFKDYSAHDSYLEKYKIIALGYIKISQLKNIYDKLSKDELGLVAHYKDAFLKDPKEYDKLLKETEHDLESIKSRSGITEEERNKMLDDNIIIKTIMQYAKKKGNSKICASS